MPASVDLSNSAVTANNASADGGGVYNRGTLTATDGSINQNTANTAGGGIEDNSGAGLGVTLTNVTLDNNVAQGTSGNGGGLHVTGDGDVNITGGSVSGNSAASEGGGIWNDTGTLTIDGTTIDGNTAGHEGFFVNFNINMSSDPGDYIGQGQTYAFNNSTGAITGFQAFSDSVIIDYRETGSPLLWTYEFAAPRGTSLVPGTYTGATRAATRDPGDPGLDIFGDGRGSNTLTGTFTVYDIEFAPDGSLQTFDASFEQHSEGGTPALYGRVTATAVGGGTGGGVFNAGGNVNVTNGTLSNNSASGTGGGIANSSGGTLDLSSSTVTANNSRDGGGGGIWNNGSLTLTNSTISGNTVGTDGGGIFTTAGTATVNNSTIAYNRTDSAGTDAGTGGGIFHDDTGSVTLNSTIVADNFVGTGTTGSDVNGTVSGTYNLVGVDTGLTGLTNGVDNNIVGTAANPIDPDLQPLADNGGPTLTQAILPGSPALNAGDNPLSLTTDQRGGAFVRSFGSQTDIGAYELQAAAGGGNDIAAYAPGPGTPGIVQVVNAITQDKLFSFEPYPGFTGGVRVAVGDVTGDGVPDVITGAGPGGGPHIKVINGATQEEVYSFFAFDAGFTGGVYVAAADVNGDNQADIIVGADAGGGPNVIVFNGADPDPMAVDGELFNFFAYDAAFTGGVRVAAGDITGDGTPDIITAAGPGGGPHVRVFDGTVPLLGNSGVTDIAMSQNNPLGSFFAYDRGLHRRRVRGGGRRGRRRPDRSDHRSRCRRRPERQGL